MFGMKKKEAKIERQEKDITNAKRILHRKMNRDLQKQKELIDILSNGITFRVKEAIGGRHV